MFELAEEHRMLQDLVAKFIDRDVIPREEGVLAREMSATAISLCGSGRVVDHVMQAFGPRVIGR